MGDLILVDFKDRRKECKFIDPQSIPEIIHLDKCIKETIKAMVKCTADKQYMQAKLVEFQDLLDKCCRDIPK